MLQPVNEQQWPVKIQPEYEFTTPPPARCIYHPQPIRHFCTEPQCLMPLCQECITNHPREHARYIDSLEQCLTDTYRGYAQKANDIATHSRNDILSLRKDLHRMVDDYIDDILSRVDNNYEESQQLEWRNLIKRLEKLRDPQNCLQQLIYYYSNDKPYNNQTLLYRGQPLEVNVEALDGIRHQLHRLFIVDDYHDRYYMPYDEPEPRKKKSRRKRNKSKTIYHLHNYGTPVRTIVQQPQPIFVQDIPQYAKPQPLVVYQESPIKFLQQSQPQMQPVYTVPQQSVMQQAIPMVKTPQTVHSVYPHMNTSGGTVQPFLTTSNVNLPLQTPWNPHHPYMDKQQT